MILFLFCIDSFVLFFRSHVLTDTVHHLYFSVRFHHVHFITEETGASVKFQRLLRQLFEMQPVEMQCAVSHGRVLLECDVFLAAQCRSVVCVCVYVNVCFFH